MNEETINMEIRKFLKKVGITSQREIEKAINSSIESGQINGNEKLPVTMHLEMPATDLSFEVKGEIALEDQLQKHKAIFHVNGTNVHPVSIPL